MVKSKTTTPADPNADTTPTFETVEIPKRTKAPGTGRTAAPNPYSAIVKTLAEEMGDADQGTRAVKVTVPGNANRDDNIALRRVRRYLNDAGTEHNVTVYWNCEKVDENSVAVTFWVTKKVYRPRKNKTENDENTENTES